MKFLSDLFSFIFHVIIITLMLFGLYKLTMYIGNKRCETYGDLYKLKHNYNIFTGCKLNYNNIWYDVFVLELELTKPKKYNGELTIINREESK